MEQGLLTSTNSKSRLKRSRKPVRLDKSNKKKPSWGLRKTLKRLPNFRELNERDLPFAWASYKTGYCDVFGFEEDMQPQEFKDNFFRHVSDNYNVGWTLMAQTGSAGFRPIGMVFGRDIGPIILIETAIWFPGSTLRRKLEAVVNLVKEGGKKRNLTFFSAEDNKRFAEVICSHGIARRVGHKHGINRDLIIEFESKGNRQWP